MGHGRILYPGNPEIRPKGFPRSRAIWDRFLAGQLVQFAHPSLITEAAPQPDFTERYETSGAHLRRWPTTAFAGVLDASPASKIRFFGGAFRISFSTSWS